MTSARNENTQFIDELTGEPIVGGSIYIGDQNLDPVINPKTIYPDRGLVGTPLANPQTTGADGRSLNKLWIDGKYSLKVTSVGGTQKLLDLDRGDDALVGNSRLIDTLGINAITATGSPTIQTLVDGQSYVFQAPAIPTGAVTLAIDAIPAKAIKKAHDQAIESGDWKADQKLVVVYNGAVGTDWFELQSAVAGSVFAANVTIGGDILDANGNEIIELTETASAVNHLSSTNSITTVGPTLSAVGDDANIDLNLVSKGTGTLKFNGLIVARTILIDPPVEMYNTTQTGATWVTVTSGAPSGSSAVIFNFQADAASANDDESIFIAARVNGSSASTALSVIGGNSAEGGGGGASSPTALGQATVGLNASGEFQIYVSATYDTTLPVVLNRVGYIT